MASLLKCGAVFLHVPKTGGSWVRDTLKACGLLADDQPDYHVHADMLRVMNKSFFQRDSQTMAYLFGRRMEKIFRPMGLFRSRVEEPELDAFTFCFVRHPLRWYESVWRAGSRSGVYTMTEDQLQKFVATQRDPRMREWHPFNEIRPCYREDFNAMMREINRQCPGYVSRIFSAYTTSRIDFVGKQESLADDLVRVLQQLNVNFDETRLREKENVNVSPQRQIEWDPAVQALTERLDYLTFHRFGYATETLDAIPDT